MLEDVLFVILGLLVAFNVGHLLTLRRCETALFALTLESKAISQFNPSEMIESMKQETLDLVHDVMGQKEKSLDAFKEIYEVDYGYRDVAKRVESSYGG